MLNGVIIIDKPAGRTSHDVVSMVKRSLGVKKAGHTGTLDPLATGVLPVCLNEATKLARFLADEHKEYRATMFLGTKTDTLDIQGNIVGRSDVVRSDEEIMSALAGKVGRITQVPPAFSAVKYCGQPLYKWARSGVMLNVQPREVEIYSIAVENIAFPEVTFRVACSKGTYIRTLCADVGEELGCGACLSSLRRLKSGLFSEEMAVSLDNGSAASRKEDLKARILPMTRLLPLLKTIEVEENFAHKLRSGLQPSVGAMKDHVLPFLETGDMVKFISRNGCLVALAEVMASLDDFSQVDEKSQAVRIVRVFNNMHN